MCVHTQVHMHAVSSIQLYPMSAFVYPSPQSRYVLFPSPEGSLSLPFYNSLPPLPQPWQLVVCSLFIILPFPEYFINGVVVHMSFLLSVTLWKFIHVVGCMDTQPPSGLLRAIP